MKAYEEVFFSLVRNSLWNSPVEVPPGFKEWKRVIRMANVQAMHGAVAKGLLASPEILNPLPESVHIKMNNMMMTNVYMHTKANCYVQLLVNALRDVGIEPVLLKGQGLAVNYLSPEVRQCGDIDLYVGVENYRKAYEVLKPVVDDIDDPSVLDGSGKHFHAQISGSMIEVHRFSEVSSSRWFDRVYQRYAADGLSKNLVSVPFGDVVVSTPADNFNAFYIFSHLWNHFLNGGVGLRQVCDLVTYLHSRSSAIDKVYLHKVLTDMKLVKPWQTFGCIAVDVLGLPEEEYPFYDPRYRKKALKVLKVIMSEGNFGKEYLKTFNRPKGFLRGKLYSFAMHSKRNLRLFKMFPKEACMQNIWLLKSGIIRLFKD